MEKEYDNSNSGALYKNEYKESEIQPDYKGPLNVDGKELEIAGWIKTSKAGKKYMSLKVQEPFKKRDQPVQQETTPFDDDSIPF